jgi:hypothetical protein
VYDGPELRRRKRQDNQQCMATTTSLILNVNFLNDPARRILKVRWNWSYVQENVTVGGRIMKLRTVMKWLWYMEQ